MAYATINNKLILKDGKLAIINLPSKVGEFLFEDNLYDEINKDNMSSSGTIYYDNGLVNRCVELLGTSYINTTNQKILNTIGNEFSISFWLKWKPGDFTEWYQNDFYNNYFFIIGTSQSLIQMSFTPDSSYNGFLTFLLNNNSQGSTNDFELFKGWHHIVWISANSRHKAYVDNQLIFNYNYNTKITGPMLRMGFISTASSNLFFDQLRIYNYGLSSNEISSLYNGGSGI